MMVRIVLVREFVYVAALVLVQMQGEGERVEDFSRGAGEAALFEAGVVVGADHRQLSDLLPAKAG
jgi:hypothetical protein